MHRLPVLALIPLAVIAIAQSAAGGHTAPFGHTKKQAEVNVLGAVETKWKVWPLRGLVDRRTHLVLDNTEAVCHSRGRRLRGARYIRFVCVVRPHVHHGRQGLYVGYRAIRASGFRLILLVYRKR
jgi:hypothetical protein